MGNWTLPYIMTSIPWDAESEAFDRRVVEALVILHRMRGDGVQAGLPYWVVRAGRTSNTVKIGFSTDPFVDDLMKGSPFNHRVSADMLGMVKHIAG